MPKSYKDKSRGAIRRKWVLQREVMRDTAAYEEWKRKEGIRRCYVIQVDSMEDIPQALEAFFNQLLQSQEQGRSDG